MSTPNVFLSQGDIFKYNKGLIVIPRSTSGSISVTFEKGLHQLGIKPLQEETPLGTVSVVWNASETFKDLHIAYATSVNVNSSNFTTIATIAFTLHEQLRSSKNVVDVACPLLGTGAGNLEPFFSFTYLILPFITEVRPYNFNVVIYDSLVYEGLKKISLDRYTIVKNTIQQVFQQVRKDQSITDIIKSKDFFFQIAQERLIQLLRSELNEEQKLELLKQHQEFKGTFQEFLDQQANPVTNKFLSSIGELITYLDIKGYNGGRWNQYPDKRAIVRANIRQGDWVKNIIQYTIHRNTELLPRGIVNAIKYILKPDREFPIISERDRKLILDTIGDFPQHELGFNDLVRRYFEQIGGPRPVNEANVTLLLARLIYSPLVRLLWDPDIKKIKGSKKRSPIVQAVQQDYNISDTQKIIFNRLHRTKVDNDVSFGSVDLLNFQKDIRAFSTLIAMRDIQPPLAIVLFGKWGSGKSFFMHHLKRNVSELSKNQELPYDPEGAPVPGEPKPYCQGIVQIEFNAWSYLDSNLWAGLVSIVFEKLDDYIRENAKGDARQALNDQLEIATSQKFAIKKEIENLTDSKKNIEGRIETAEKEKDDLLAKVQNQTLKDIRDAALKDVQPLINKIEVKAQEVGIEKERLRELSPVALYEELRSWMTFFKLLFQFKLRHKIILCVSILLLAWFIFDPHNYIADNLKTMARGAIVIATLIGPPFLKFYFTVVRYKKLLHPILEIKNKFIDYTQAAEFDHSAKMLNLQTLLGEKTAHLEQLRTELNGVEKEIHDITYTLDHYVTKKAFFDFIRKKK